MTGEIIHTRVSLVVLLIDDFTGKVIVSPDFRLTIPGAGRPIHRSDGFWIFTNVTAPKVWLKVESSWYYPEERQIELSRMEKEGPIVRIRLKPGLLCPRLTPVTGLLARLAKGSLLYVYQRQGGTQKKLMADYERGNGEICLYQGEREHLEGRVCCVADKDGEPREFVRLESLTDPRRGVYQLERPLHSDYKKIRTLVSPVTTMQAGETAEYYLALSAGSEAETEYVCIIRDGERSIEELRTFISGTMNRIDWTAADGG